ncbi:four helix bundle protein [Dysgonomonas sp. 520]|uniref:four helix bundle protein n=1 Tax=Dysgonomonas sp. 520 TaxID=2302931 RepID=UPI0013D7D3AF|nr:four helix bundle protein [Dysgonomonas sp. 520]
MMTHKDLIVWKKGINLVKVVYDMTAGFPSSEQFGLTSQIRRSAVSIPSNIAEGCGRNSDKELIQFLYIALGSATELETQIIISGELNFLKKEDVAVLNESVNEIIKMTTSLIKSLKTRNETK